MSGPRAAVRALIVRDRHVLVNVYQHEHGTEYLLPGGGQEYGESQVEALRRECREEIGADVDVHQLALVMEELQEHARDHHGREFVHHQINVVFWCGLAEGQEPSPGSDPDPRQVGTAWLPLADLPEDALHPLELVRWLRENPSSRPPRLWVHRP